MLLSLLMLVRPLESALNLGKRAFGSRYDYLMPRKIAPKRMIHQVLANFHLARVGTGARMSRHNVTWHWL